MGDSGLNRRTYGAELVWQLIGADIQTMRHHAAPNVHADRGGDNCFDCRDHGAHGRAHAPVRVRHCRDVLVDERQRAEVLQLLARALVEIRRPDLHWHATGSTHAIDVWADHFLDGHVLAPDVLDEGHILQAPFSEAPRNAFTAASSTLRVMTATFG